MKIITMGFLNFLSLPSTSLLFMGLTWLLVLQTVEPKTYWGDIQVMKELKNSVEPGSLTPGSCLSSWDFSVDPCDNLSGEKFTCGFRCDGVISKLGRVTELSLDQAGYSGSLSAVSWNLPYLQTLDLSNNYFSGTIPGSLSNLNGLTRLGLSENLFSGEIPASIGELSGLEELYLDHNNLEGTIPQSFNGLISLTRLELQSNRLSGKFPDLSSLRNLSYFDASDNAMSGEVPTTLPTSLIQITMRNNSLEGSIPENFRYFKFLQVMDLSHNKLSNSVPSFLFTHPSLQQLTLSFNRFTSVQSPPSSILSAIQSEIIAIDLSNNEIGGFLPFFMGLMPKLSALSLENNKFTGMIPTQYALKVAVPGTGVAPFERLLLGGNYLFGPIPSPLMALKPGSANIRLGDNCLYRCPVYFFFCQGADQKSFTECKRFNPTIP